jgi:hypothetical protein
VILDEGWQRGVKGWYRGRDEQRMTARKEREREREREEKRREREERE